METRALSIGKGIVNNTAASHMPCGERRLQLWIMHGTRASASSSEDVGIEITPYYLDHLGNSGLWHICFMHFCNDVGSHEPL